MKDKLKVKINTLKNLYLNPDWEAYKHIDLNSSEYNSLGIMSLELDEVINKYNDGNIDEGIELVNNIIVEFRNTIGKIEIPMVNPLSDNEVVGAYKRIKPGNF